MRRWVRLIVLAAGAAGFSGLVWTPVARADDRGCHRGGYYGGGYDDYDGGGSYGRYYPRRQYRYGDPYHVYGSPGRVHNGPHSGFHVGPYNDDCGFRRYGPHRGYHYDLHGRYGHYYGL